MSSEPFIYTDVALAQQRAQHNLRTIQVSLAVLTLNGIGWASFAWIHGGLAIGA
jgi:hypothetical protein